MFNLAISIGIAAAIGALIGTLTGGWVGGLIPGIIVLVGMYIYISRKIMKILEALMMTVQAELQPKNPTKGVDKAQINRAIDILKSGYRLNHWQFMTKKQIDGQIGMIYFLNKDFGNAEPFLDDAVYRNWVAKAMLAVIYFKRKRYEDMKRVFEVNVKTNKKESLLWNVYAYCLWKSKDRDGAIDVLSKALEILKDDERIESNKLALQKNKKMKMRGWKEMWYQFHLDKPQQPKMIMDRKSMYRGR